MKIGFDAKRIYQNRTGLGHYSRTLVSSLAKYYPGNEYILFAPRKTNLYDESRQTGVTVVKPKSFFYKKFKSLWRSSAVKKDLLAAKIDLYHGLSHEIPRGIDQSGIASVVTIHDLIFEIFPGQYKVVDRFIYRKKFRYACRHANHIIAISKQTKNDIVNYYKIDAQKITVCYQSCDERYSIKVTPENKSATRKRYNLPEKYFLYVGSIIERKNLLTICKALKHLWPQLKIPLVVIGDGSSYKKIVKNFLYQNKLEDAVIFLSETVLANNESFRNSHDFPAIYQGASAFIYPSIYEGFGIPVLEALNSGTPVITTPVSCMPETGGDAAKYVDPYDEQALATAMANIAKNEELAAEMIKKGFVHAARFSREQSAADVMNVYKKVLYGNG